MRIWIVSALGGVLIFSTHQIAPLLSPASVEIVTTTDSLNTPDFALIMSRWSWWVITLQNQPNIDRLSESAWATLRPVVNKALERAGVRCEDNWTLTDAFELSNPREIGVGGY